VIVSAEGGNMWASDEKRRHVRYTYLADMEYMLKPPIADEILQGAVVNVSNSGMSLFITKPLDIGQEITIRSSLPNLAQTAVVRWIKQVGGCYKIGAECNDLE
jgi:hypothetical protein